MARQILIIPDKSKCSISAPEMAGAIARGWSAACQNDKLALLPMSDGGDGFGPMKVASLGLAERVADVVDAA